MITSRMLLFFVITWWYILSFNCIVGERKGALIEDSVNITINWYLTVSSVQGHEIGWNTCKTLPRQTYIVINNGHEMKHYNFTINKMDLLVSWVPR